MATPGPADRIRNAVADAAAKLTKQAGAAIRRDTPEPGDLMSSMPGRGSAWSGWSCAVIQTNPGCCFSLPYNFPLAGTPNLVLSPEIVGRPLTVRCGQTDWFPANLCASRLRVGAVPEQALLSVRQRMADFARGRAIATENPSIDSDPEYEEWIAEVARARIRASWPAPKVRGLKLVSSFASLHFRPRYLCSLSARPSSHWQRRQAVRCLRNWAKPSPTATRGITRCRTLMVAN